MPDVDPIALDFETHLIRPGLAAPPPVCVATYPNPDATLKHCVLDPEDALHEVWRSFVSTRGVVGANFAFDACVAMARWPELTKAIFGAYEDGRVLDVQLNQKLADVARGRLYGYVGEDKITYSLAALEKRLLGRDRFAQKGPDAWRTRYGELADERVGDDAPTTFTAGESEQLGLFGDGGSVP